MRNATKNIEKFTKTIILIDFIGLKNGSNLAQNLKYKLDKNHHNSTRIIPARTFIENQGQMNILLDSTGMMQITLLAHGTVGMDTLVIENPFINSKDKETIPATQLAENLANLIGNNKAVVNLVVCGAGRGDQDIMVNNSANSLAAKLHHALAKKIQRDIPVIARTHVTFISKNTANLGEKRTIGLNLTWDEAERCILAKNPCLLISKQPGSKVIYKMDSAGNQIRMDAYTQKWKAMALYTIRELAKNTAVLDTKTFLLSWLQDFRNQKPQAIFATLRQEVANDESILKKYEPCLLRFFFKNSELVTIQQVIRQGMPYFYCPYTVHDPIHTGLSLSSQRMNQ